MLVPLPEPTPTIESLLQEFFDFVRQARTLDAVNIAAGIAGEEIQKLTP
jgi:hypothetical protein